MKNDNPALAIPRFTHEPASVLNVAGNTVNVFLSGNEPGNLDKLTVDSFSKEWERFDAFNDEELGSIGDEYFDLIGEEQAHSNAVVLDLGCGSGRWSKYLASRVGHIDAIDPGDSVYVAARMLQPNQNVRISRTEVSSLPFADNTFDFIFSLGVLHHVPDTEGAVRTCQKKLKPSGWLLLYLYYRFDNRGPLFRSLFRIADGFRKGISRLPYRIRHACTDVIALLVYLPFVSIARLLKALFPGRGYYKSVPLSYYVNKRFYIMRNDALDRFGTPLEKRFTQSEIEAMLLASGFKNIRFSPNPPYWHVIAQKEA